MFKVVSLFAGAGGLSRGFSDKFSIELAVDNNPYAAATFKANFPRTRVLCSPVKDVKWNYELEKIGLVAEDINVVIGGPPCQGFSKGNSQTREENHPLNSLWKNYLDVVEILQPEWFVMENVPGMGNINGNKGTISEIVKVFKKRIGYHVEVKTLLASQFGVPQNRKRVIFVGSRDGYKFPFPKPLYKKEDLITVENAICGDLPSLEDKDGNIIEGNYGLIDYSSKPLNHYQSIIRSGSKGVTGHVTVKSSEEVRGRWRDIPPGGNWSSISENNVNGWRNVSNTELKRVSHSNLYKRLDPKKPAITIAHFRRSMICHPFEDRIISIREAARLQSFPDAHKFVGTKDSQQQMVANAVPPILAKALARQVLYCLAGYIELKRAPVQAKIF